MLFFKYLFWANGYLLKAMAPHYIDKQSRKIYKKLPKKRTHFSGDKTMGNSFF